jgi:hypothetical protein
MIKAKWMKPMNITSSFSNREKMRRNPFNGRNSRTQMHERAAEIANSESGDE